jgi:hypothetical protein
MNFRLLLASASHFPYVWYDILRNHKDKNVRDENEESTRYSVLFSRIFCFEVSHIFMNYSENNIWSPLTQVEGTVPVCLCEKVTALCWKWLSSIHETLKSDIRVEACLQAHEGYLQHWTVTATSTLNNILRSPLAHGRPALPHFAILFCNRKKCILFDGNLINETSVFVGE